MSETKPKRCWPWQHCWYRQYGERQRISGCLAPDESAHRRMVYLFECCRCGKRIERVPYPLDMGP